MELIDGVLVSAMEVRAAADELHKNFTRSRECTLSLIDRLTQAGWNWYRCQFSPRTIAGVHVAHHREGNLSLIPEQGGTVELGRQVLETQPDYERESPVCYQTIQAIRSRIAAGESVGPILLHQSGMHLRSIDGLHRMLAWLLEDRSDAMTGYAARPQ